MDHPPALQVSRAESATGWWEFVRRPPHPRLASLVTGLCGYREASSTPVERRMAATTTVPVILSFGDTIDVEMGDHVRGGFASFVAGLHPGPATTRFRGRQFGVQVDLTPLGAYRVFGMPGTEVAHRVVDLHDVAPRLGSDSMQDRLASERDWARRLAVVDDVLALLVADGPEPDALVRWMWQQLRVSRGTARIGDLVAETGHSHRHVTDRFRRQVGLTPKAAARVIRFEHAAGAVAAGRAPLADVAVMYGYADQSHLTREFVALAGTPPRSSAGSAG